MHPLLASSNVTDEYSAASIDRLEGSLGVRLPEDYRQFLVDTNGGVPCRTLLRFYNEVDEEEQDTSVLCFYALDDPRPPNKRRKPFEASIEHVLEAVMQVNLPERRLLPIGQDVSGNILCLSLEEDTFGHVFFNDHDYDEIYPLASSFAEFVNLLEDEPAE